MIALKCLGTIKESSTLLAGSDAQEGHGLGIIKTIELQ